MKRELLKDYLSKYWFLKVGVKLCMVLSLFLLLANFFVLGITILMPDEGKVSNKKENKLTLTEAMYYSQLPNNKVQCLLCPRNCLIKDGQRGFCNARLNKKGKLYSLVYGKPLIKNNWPIYERSLIFCSMHANILRLGTAGCNLRCKFCLLWGISQAKPEEIETSKYFNSYFNHVNAVTGASPTISKKIFVLMPQDIINEAKKHDCKGVLFNINEPTIYYEYMLDIARLAKKEGLFVMLGTNGYINKEPLYELIKYVDFVSVGIKGFTDDIYRKHCSGELSPILETLKILHAEKIKFEIAFVVIPTVNDDFAQIKNMCIWIKNNLGEEVPLHLYRYTPSYLYTNLPLTPLSTLDKIKLLAEESGLKYIYTHYLGNLPSPDWEEKIYCPNCHKLVLYRKGGRCLIEDNVKKGKCIFCGAKVSFLVID